MFCVLVIRTGKAIGPRWFSPSCGITLAERMLPGGLPICGITPAKRMVLGGHVLVEVLYLQSDWSWVIGRGKLSETP